MPPTKISPISRTRREIQYILRSLSLNFRAAIHPRACNVIFKNQFYLKVGNTVSKTIFGIPVSHLLASIGPNRHIETMAGISGRIGSIDGDCHSGPKKLWHKTPKH